MSKRLIGLICVMLLTGCVEQTISPVLHPSHDDLLTANRYFAAGDIGKAKTYYHAAADAGNANAQFLLYHRYFPRMGKPASLVEYLYKSAAQGHKHGFMQGLDFILFKAKTPENTNVKRAYDIYTSGVEINPFIGDDKKAPYTYAPTYGYGEVVRVCAEAGSIGEGTTMPPEKVADFSHKSTDPYAGWQEAEKYAGGTDTQKSPRLALQLVCHSSFNRDDLWYAAGKLYYMWKVNPDASFRICDVISSPLKKAYCKNKPAPTLKEHKINHPVYNAPALLEHLEGTPHSLWEVY